MKITKTQLKQIVKEEIDGALNEGVIDEPLGPQDAGRAAGPPWLKDFMMQVRDEIALAVGPLADRLEALEGPSE